MPTESQQGELLACARELARIGGETARGMIGRVRVSRKDDNTPVTEADHAVQERLLEIIARRYPEHAIIVEETVAGPDRHRSIHDAEYCWVIDPIDGTRNFAAGLGAYATSVGLLHQGAPIVGAIHDATTGNTFSAEIGTGAFRNDDRIVMRKRPEPQDTMIFISSFRRKTVPAAVKLWMEQCLFRNQGSLCIHFAWIAAGSADAAFAPECKLWDLAAGSLLIQEAGGVITHADGRPLWPFDLSNYSGEDIPVLAASAGLHAEMLDDLNKGRA